MSNTLYPGGDNPFTPNLGLALWDMSFQMAQNMETIDAAIGAGSSSVKINGSAISNPNFNSTIPAAPANATNVIWQVSGPNVSAYIPSGSLFPVLNSLNIGKFISNGIFNECFLGNLTGSIVSVSEQINYRQFTLTASMSIGEVSQLVTTASVIVGATHSFAIYTASGNLLIDSGPFDSTDGTGNVRTNSFSQVVLNPGVYLFAWTASDAAVQLRVFTVQGFPNLITKNATMQNIIGIASNVRNGTHAMPATLGTFTFAGLQTVPICIWQF